jgi:hypothetical protein
MDGVVCSACGATAERDRRLLVGVADASPAVSSDFDVLRDLRVRLGFVFEATSSGLDAIGVGAETTAVVDFRPRPSSFASIERCSEYAGAVSG